MRRRTADDRAQADDRVKALAFGQLFRCERQFESAGNLVNGDVFLIRSRPDQRVHRAVDKASTDEIVEPACGDREFHPFGDNFSFNDLRHD